MDVFDAIRSRFSARGYTNQKVEKEKLMTVLEAARMAPSASNRQEWRFVVVEDAETRRNLCQAAQNQAFVAEAPVVIACVAQTDGHRMRCGQLSYPIDVAIAIDHMTLAATALGLGTCWIGAFDANHVREILSIPAHIEVVELLTLGYPTSTTTSKRRLSLNDIVFFERWPSSDGEAKK